MLVPELEDPVSFDFAPNLNDDRKENVPFVAAGADAAGVGEAILADAPDGQAMAVEGVR